MPVSLPPPHLSGEYDEIHYVHDRASGLRAIVVVHDTCAGPALGGIRWRRYRDEAEALDDACALARCMTRKVLLAELPAGGAKVVVLDSPEVDKAAALEALGAHVERMGGRLFTAGDLGVGPAELAHVARTTRHVATPGNGVTADLADATAEGVFLAAGTALDVLGVAEWHGQRIAIQGLGAIGIALAMRARRAGARVIAADFDAQRAGRAADTMPLQLVEPDRLWDVDCDLLAPCAAGRAIDVAAAKRLRCRIVCGAANDLLASDDAGDVLASRGILHAPDVLASAGAVIRGSGPALAGFTPPADLSGIGRRLREVLMESLAQQRAPHRIAHERADARLAQLRAARSRAPARA